VYFSPWKRDARTGDLKPSAARMGWKTSVVRIVNMALELEELNEQRLQTGRAWKAERQSLR
jgi:hypothetical protein